MLLTWTCWLQPELPNWPDGFCVMSLALGEIVFIPREFSAQMLHAC